MESEALKRIPKMDKLLARPAVVAEGDGRPHALVREAIREALDDLRDSLRAGNPMPGEAELDALLTEEIRRKSGFRLKPVVNATGVVLHTNLGRAPLGREIAAHVAEVAAGYSNLEFDLEQGKRGTRYAHIEELLCRLTGAEAAFVVNNNAAAVFLMLNTLAKGKQVVISRGELVEIGGSFRVPEIMDQSGARLLETGTTNKTHLQDYQRALSDQGAEVILKVHSSNFKITGFTEQVSLEALRPLADGREALLLYDLGAGFLFPPEQLNLTEGIYVQRAVRYADVLCFSGDKLLGGAQAGILLGKRRYIEQMKRNQLTRMLRIDKLTLAALEGVLRWYTDSAQTKERIPVLRMLCCTEGELKERAFALAETLSAVCPGCAFEAEPCADEPGGGSLPEVQLPGWAVAVTSERRSANWMEQFLRSGEIPIISRISHGKLLLAVRTLQSGDEGRIVAAFRGMEEEL